MWATWKEKDGQVKPEIAFSSTVADDMKELEIKIRTTTNSICSLLYNFT